MVSGVYASHHLSSGHKIEFPVLTHFIFHVTSLSVIEVENRIGLEIISVISAWHKNQRCFKHEKHKSRNCKISNTI